MKLLQHATRRAGCRLSPRAQTTAVLAALGTLLPTAAHAAEGDHVVLRLEGVDRTLLFVALGLGVIAILYGLYLARWVLAQSPGSQSMQDVGQAIKDGAVAYLRKQIGTMVGFVILLAVGLYFLYIGSGAGAALGIAAAFIAGVVGSYVAGATGMMIAVNGNMRTANAALTSYRRSLETAFRSGAVAGLLTVGIGLVGAAVILLIGGSGATRYLIGFGFGGSLAALFMRVGGGIFTKAADVGADLVGKVEAGIPEDDPRNPAVIADNVGDNVGDCAGMAADVFESYLVTLVSAIVLAAATSAVLDQADWTRLVIFALIISAIGIFASIFGIATLRGSDDIESDPLKPIRRGFYRTAALSTILTFAAAYFLMGGQRPIQTSQLVSSQETLRQDVIRLAKLREEIASRRPTEALIATARTERGRTLGKPAEQVTPAELFNDPTNVPNGIRGYSQAAVQRVLDKSNAAVKPYEVTEFDVLAHPQLKNSGFESNPPLTGQLLGVRPEVLNGGPNVANLRRITDLNARDIEALDYAMPAPTANPTLGANQQYVPVRDFFRGKGKDAYVVALVRTQVSQPARPAQNGLPAQPAANIDRQEWQGPVKLAELEQAIKDTQTAAAQQNVKFSATVLRSSPVELFVSPTGDLAYGITADVPHPILLQQNPRGQAQRFAYFPVSVQEMTALSQRTAGAQPAALPPARAMELVSIKSNPVPWWAFGLATLVGLILAIAIEKLTEYYVSTHKKPTQEVAGVSSGGAAPMIIQGFAYAAESSAMMVVAIVGALLAPLFLFNPTTFGGYVLPLYGVALVGLGLLSTTGYVLAMDTFGPISDNAQGVFEMSGAGHDNPQGAKAVGRLDAAGNTTKALTKGFAIATAVVAAIALFNSFRSEANLTEIGLKLDVPEIFLGLLIGGAAPFLFSAFAINAVGRAAFELINEVRRQFRENPGIMEGTTRPDYGRCVALVTAAAQRELLAPGILAIALPAAVAFGFSIGRPTTTINGAEYNLTGAQALGGFLAGAILSGQLMAVLLANSGGMWDNAKKLIEDGLYGGKGSEAHKASVICDTVGDPFKDTAGPALNPLIKVMNLVALLLAPVIIQPLSNTTLTIITLITVAILVVSFWLSKKGSLSDELNRAASAGEAAAAHFDSPAIPPPAPNEIPPTATPKRRITVEDDEPPTA